MQPVKRSSDLTEFDLGYYGWRVVLAACLGVMAGFGSLFVYTFSVFVKPLVAEFGWSREAISSGFAIAAVTLGVISPFLGRWIDRFSPRRIILVCMTIYAIASLSLLRSGLWQFYATCFVLGLVGNGAAHLAYSRSISTWFQRRLGMALAFVMVGAGLGAMILPVVAQAIIGQSGWRAAHASLGGLALLLGLPLSWRYIREREVIGHGSAPVAHSGMTWQQGLRSFVFWIITAILFVSSISMNGAITHLSALLTDRGLPARNAALCASILGGSSLLGRILVGGLLDFLRRFLRQFAARRPLRDFPDDPRIAIGVLEGNVGTVALALRIGTADARLRGERRAVEDIGRLDTVGHDLLVSGHDIGDDQPAAERTGLGHRNPFAKRDRGRRVRRRKLNGAKIFAVDDILIDSPPELCVKRLCAIHVQDGNNSDFELHIDFHVKLLIVVISSHGAMRLVGLLEP
jgi:MFS family permease